MYATKDLISKYKLLLEYYLINYKGIIDLKKPFNCLNPKHEDIHPSMFYSSKYHICKCFSCGISYDIFDLIGIDYGINNFNDKINFLNNLFSNGNLIISESKKINNDYIKKDYSNYYKKCSLNVNKTNYLLDRKLDLELIKKYNIGYDINQDLIIFPINKYCYYARGVSTNKKFKSKGISYIWNEELLKDNSNNLLYVTESVFDSLSLETIDPNVKTIALNGLYNYKRLLTLISENDYKGNLVLAFDNDKAGLMYQEIVKKELINLNIPSFSVTLISNIDNVKDINEALIKDRTKLEKNYNYFNENIKKIISKNKESDLIL